MNDKIKNAKHDELANKLMDIAQHANADPHFVADLEDKLTMTHKTKQNGTTPSFRSMIPSLGWVGFVIAFGFVLNWSIRNLIPAPQPASGGVIFNEATLTLTAELAVQESATSIPDDRSYDWRGTKLYLAQPLPDTPVEANIYVLNSDQYESVSQKRRFGNDGIIMEGQPVEYDLVGTYEILSAEDAFQKILSPDRPAGLLEIFIGKGGGGGGGVGFYKLNLTGNPVIFPTTTPTTQPYPTPQINDLPTATIEVVMLNYYVRDPSSERWHPLYDIYIQPIWRFAGHYNNGDEFEFLVQALKEVYLLPELAPYTPPG